MTKAIIYGVAASLLLLTVYFTVLTLISGWNFALDQFKTYWYFIITLTAGFGLQVFLYQYLKNLVHSGQGMNKVVGISGAISTTAMISCCAHYLVNLAPILGVAGLITLMAQYQIKLFWLGIIFNLGGIAYIAARIFKLKTG